MAGYRPFDVVILGAGPAGLALGTLLRPERRVLVLERRARPATSPPIGESLPGAAAVLLRRLDLLATFQDAGHRERGATVSVWDSDRPVWRDAIRDPAGPGWYLDRRGFERMLRRRALDAGVTLREGCKQANIRHRQGQWHLDTALGPFRAPMLVDATGRSGHLGRQLGLRRHAEDPLLCLYCFMNQDFLNQDFLNQGFLDQAAESQDGTMRIQADAHGWWYTVPLPHGQRVLAYHLDVDDPLCRRLLRRPDAFLARARDHALLAEVLEGRVPARIRGRPAGTSVLDVAQLPKAGPGFLAIGDALLAFDPLASQGLFHSLASATSAANAIVSGLHQSLGAYQQEMQAVTRRYLWHLKASYQGPRRFGQETFWQRRQGTVDLGRDGRVA